MLLASPGHAGRLALVQHEEATGPACGRGRLLRAIHGEHRGVIGGERVCDSRNPAPWCRAGPWCSWCRLDAHSAEMTSLTAARAADRSTIFLTAAYRDRQFRPAEPHPGHLVAAGDVHDDMARFTMAAHRAGSPDWTPSSRAPHWLSLQMVATRRRHDTRYPPFGVRNGVLGAHQLRRADRVDLAHHGLLRDALRRPDLLDMEPFPGQPGTGCGISRPGQERLARAASRAAAGSRPARALAPSGHGRGGTRRRRH